jgi:hypothetical protein
MGQEIEDFFPSAFLFFYAVVIISGLVLLLESSRPNKRNLVRLTVLVRAFALFGFCSGIFISGLLLFKDNLGLHAWSIPTPVILLFLPFLPWDSDYDPGKIDLYMLLLMSSVFTGFFYGLIGLLVQYLLNIWRRHSVENKT